MMDSGEPLCVSDPDLAEAVSSPPRLAGGTPSERWTNARDWDASFRPGDPEGGFNRYGWNAADQAAFEALWPAEGDRWVDDLIDDYAAMWPWIITRVLQARAPGIEPELRRLYQARIIGRPPPGARPRQRLPEESYTTTISVDINTGSATVTGPKALPPQPRHWGIVRHDEYIVVETALMYGPFDHARARRSWPEAPVIDCRICGHRQEARLLRSWMLERHGPPRYCRDCNMRIRTGRYIRRKADVISGVQRLAETLERIPPQGVHLEPLGGYVPEKRDQVAAALIVAPDPAWAKKAVKGKWLDVLKAAGLVTDAWRPARGTYCAAADGHPCRSLAERNVDDWLSSHRIEHEPEPKYPGSSKRADWRLPDGTLVEYAGLLGDEKYRAKMAEKRALARETGTRLIVLVPEDLRDLGARLGEWIQPSEASNDGALPGGISILQ